MPPKNVKKEAELPTFLLGLNANTEDASFLPKTTESSHYLGPLFFGESHQYHPPLHSVNFSTFRHVQKTFSEKENIQDLFLKKKQEIKKHFKRPKLLKLVANEKFSLLPSDPHPHQAPGTRKVFVPEVGPALMNLGETTSIIEGETTLEIPLHRLKKFPSSTNARQFELVMLSDLKEKKRISMPYNERISHIHYPKQFVNVTVIGPTIPAAITIKKLPSKRKTEFEMSLLINSKDKKPPSKEEAEESKEGQDVRSKESKSISWNDERLIKTQRSSSNMENSVVDESQEEGSYLRFGSEVNQQEIEEITEIKEEESEEENEDINTTVELLSSVQKEEQEQEEEEEEKKKNSDEIENFAEKGEEQPNVEELEN